MITAKLTITPHGSRAQFWHTRQHSLSYSSTTCKPSKYGPGRDAKECSQNCFNWLTRYGFTPDTIDFIQE